MSKKLLSIVSAGAAAAALVSAAFTPQAVAQNSNGAFRFPAAARPHQEKRDRALVVAMRSLERAKDALQRADRDSAGHREQALDLVNRAMEQTRLAMSHDR